MNTDAKFRFAHLDNDKEIIHINEVNSDVRNNHKFWCIGCGGELKAALGNKRIHYFSHKVNESHCSRETYLHKLGKQKVVSAFNTQEQFPIVLRSRNKCERYPECNLKKYVKGCTETGDVLIDLKEHYGRCEEEFGYKGFVADVALIAKEEHRSPIFIEIVVTHKCSEEKRQSGIHIIEWTINDESDVERILFMQTRPNIEFINFNGNKPRYLPTPVLLDKFYVKDIGGQLIASMEKETIKCYEQDKRTDESSVLEIVSNDVEHDARYFSNIAIGIAIRKLGNRFKWCGACVRTFRCTPTLTQTKEDGTVVRQAIKNPDGSLAAYCNDYRVHSGLQQRLIQRYSIENYNIVYAQIDESREHDRDADTTSNNEQA
ncbi:MAG: competence protein CoiA [Marinilabiliaceae bacterium]|nr:competence protein CoiA [Marinilabiliaceae bacterium]